MLKIISLLSQKAVSFLFLTLLCISPIWGQNSYKYHIPENRNDGWETASLTSQHIDTTLIFQFFNQLIKEKHKVHSVLLVKNSQLVLESYFGNTTVDRPHDLRSATKSITSLLMGIAIDKGFINSVDDPVNAYVPLKAGEHTDPIKETITLRHLLTMSTGLDCNDWDKKSKGQEDHIYKKQDWLQYFIDLPLINPPGEVAAYCTMGQILATEAIARASGMAIDEFAQKYLFQPLGITNLQWGHTSKKNVIASGKRLYMTSRDIAKIGQLLLNKGKWDGQQIISEKWLEASTTPHTKISGLDYGFLWWRIPFQGNQKLLTAICATGNGGQYLMLFPELDMMAVFTGGAYNSNDDKLPFAIVNKVFIPSITSKRAP